MAELKDRLRQLRKENKMTQQDVANFLGITESAYGYYEQGRNEPSLEKLKKLSDKYAVSLSYISGETDNPNESTRDEIKRKALFFDEENMDEEDWELLEQTYERLKNKRKKM